MKLNSESIQRLRNHGFSDEQIMIVDKYLGGKVNPPDELLVISELAAVIEFFRNTNISETELGLLLKKDGQNSDDYMVVSQPKNRVSQLG